VAALTLRFPELADAEALLEAIQESIAEMEPSLSWCHPGYSSVGAVRLAARWAFENTGLARLEIVVAAGNTRS
jgi:hypothetical protein